MQATRLPMPALLAGISLLAIALRFVVHGLLTGDWSFGTYVDAFCFQDCGWYSDIYASGYDATIGENGQFSRANWAFFPAYPLLVALVGRPLGLPAPWAGFIVSNLLAILSAWAARPLFGAEARAYWLWCIGLLAGPFSFLFSALYTESLFILLTIMVLVALQRRDYARAGGWAMLLSATRVTGVLMALALLASMIRDHLRDGRPLSAFPARLFAEPHLLLALLLAPTGLALFMIFLYVHTGDALAFAHIQRGWDRELGDPITNVLSVFSTSLSFDYFDLLKVSGVLAVLAALALSLRLLVTGRLAAALFCLLVIALSLASGVGSLVRFTAGLAPLGMALAELGAKTRAGTVAFALLGLATGLLLTIGWFNGSWFLM